MIIRQTFPAWYSDCLPDGTHVNLFPHVPEIGFVGRIDTSRGRIPLPPEINVLFDACAVVGGRLVVAGQGGDSAGLCWLWNGEQWLTPCGTYGTSPCAFYNGQLYVSVGPWVQIVDPLTGALLNRIDQSIGARGIAAVDARGIHSVDGWYGGDLAEFVDLDGIRIGQDFTDGCAISVDSKRYLLEPGNVQFIRAHRDGDAIAVAIVKPLEARAVCFWFTVADITTLPPVSAPPIVPPPVPPPQPPPEPPKMRTIPTPPRAAAIVQALYERHQDLAQGTDDQRRSLMWLIAQQQRFELGPGWGTKRAGEGRPLTKDAIAFWDGSTLFVADAFNGSTRQPSVASVMDESAGQIFVEVPPVDLLGVGEPPAPPPPGPPPPSDGTLSARLAALELRVTHLEQRKLRLAVVEEA